MSETELSRGGDSRYDLGLLFTDGMPDLDDTAGYRGAIAARAAGISYLQQIRTAVNQLREAGFSDLAQTTLMSDGASVYLCTTNDEVIDLVNRGQGVFGIAVGKVLREVETSLVELDSIKGEDPADELAQRRIIRAS
jgi:hypothetical protein